ncbi:integron integrase [Verrucomicrobiota bacterium sgz303538]
MNLESVLERTRHVIRRKHMAWNTEETYCGWINRFARFVCKLPKEISSEEKVEKFLTCMARRGCSASTQNQAFNAILFLYKEVLKKPLLNINALRVRKPARVRTAPSRTEVARILSHIEQQEEKENDYPIKLIVKLLYGCGLRVSEPLNIRLKDVEFENRRLVIRDGKGGKDRVVPLPSSLVPALQEQIKKAQQMWMRDRQNGIPVPLPDALARKYPRAQESIGWYWLFPAQQTCKHPRTGQVVRWRVHEVNVQRAVRRAAIASGLDSVVTPHVLRHAFATHSLQQGVNVRDVQEVMGHSSLETTMRYLHTSADVLKSPLETLPTQMPAAPLQPLAQQPQASVAAQPTRPETPVQQPPQVQGRASIRTPLPHSPANPNHQQPHGSLEQEANSRPREHRISERLFPFEQGNRPASRRFPDWEDPRAAA